MPKNVLISSREFCRHIPSYSTTQAASNKGCLHSLCWGVSLKQRVTCVTISNKGNVVLEDLKVLRRSPDLLNNVKIGQGQLQPIMEQNLLLLNMEVAGILAK